MTAVARTYWTVECDEDGCDKSLEAYTDQVYDDAEQAREWAECEYWVSAVGKDYCPAHTPADDMRSKP